MVAEVVDVDAEHDRRVRRGRDRTDDVHQLGLAVEAAVGVVDSIRRPLHLVGDDRRPRETPFGGERPAIGLLVAGERRRHRRHGVRPVGAQRAVGDGGEERRVGAAAEGDDDVAQATQLVFEVGDQRVEPGVRVHESSVPRRTRRRSHRDPQRSRTTTRRVLFGSRALSSARARGGMRRVAPGAGSHPDSETPQTHRTRILRGPRRSRSRRSCSHRSHQGCSRAHPWERRRAPARSSPSGPIA